jgi:hypothetical protein
MVGEIRAWIREREDVVVAGPVESTPGERRLSVLHMDGTVTSMTT